MKIEDAVWDSKRYTSRISTRISNSAIALQEIKAGETKRITHDDISCNIGSGTRYENCSLSQIIRRFRLKKGWMIEYYHESPHVAVVRRLK